MSTLKVKDEEATGEVIKFLIKLKEKQKELELEKKIYYPSISLYLALKNRIFFKNLLLHTKVLEKRNYYDDKKTELTIEALTEKLAQVLEYEFSVKEELSDIERNKIIKTHKKLKKSIEKANVV